MAARSGSSAVRLMAPMFAALALLGAGGTGAWAQNQPSCVAVVAVGDPDHAEGYPLPLSLRRNLVYLVKRAMIERGEYKYETLANINGVYADRFRDAVAAAQRRLGQMPTGCLTWDIVQNYEQPGQPGR